METYLRMMFLKFRYRLGYAEVTTVFGRDLIPELDRRL
jgi:hypothetical protein